MRIDDLIDELQRYKAKHGNNLVRFCAVDENGLDRDFKVDTVYPVNIHTAAVPVWCCMLSN